MDTQLYNELKEEIRLNDQRVNLNPPIDDYFDLPAIDFLLPDH